MAVPKKRKRVVACVEPGRSLSYHRNSAQRRASKSRVNLFYSLTNKWRRDSRGNFYSVDRRISRYRTAQFTTAGTHFFKTRLSRRIITRSGRCFILYRVLRWVLYHRPRASTRRIPQFNTVIVSSSAFRANCSRTYHTVSTGGGASNDISEMGRREYSS